MFHNKKPVQFAGRTYAPSQKSGSGCGANADGGGGFQTGNTCGSSSGGGGGSKPASPPKPQTRQATTPQPTGEATSKPVKPAGLDLDKMSDVAAKDGIDISFGRNYREPDKTFLTVSRASVVQTSSGIQMSDTSTKGSLEDAAAKLAKQAGVPTKIVKKGDGTIEIHPDPSAAAKPAAKKPTAKPKPNAAVKVNPVHKGTYAGDDAKVVLGATLSDGKKVFALKTSGGTVATSESEQSLLDFADDKMLKVDGGAFGGSKPAAKKPTASKPKPTTPKATEAAKKDTKGKDSASKPAKPKMTQKDISDATKGIPYEVKHKGETYSQTGKMGTDIKTGKPSREFEVYDKEGEPTGKRVWVDTDKKVRPE